MDLIRELGDCMEFDSSNISILLDYFKQAFFIGLGVGLVGWFAPWCVSQIVSFFKRLTN